MNKTIINQKGRTGNINTALALRGNFSLKGHNYGNN